MKPFEDVQIGDIATDYFDEEFEVKDKGTVKEMCDKYGYSMSEDEIICMGWKYDDEAIVDEEGNMYLYEMDGAYVKA